MYGEKSFWASAPRLWNELPDHIKLTANKDIFCKVLETHLAYFYNFKPVYYVWYVFDLYMSSEYVLIKFSM